MQNKVNVWFNRNSRRMYLLFLGCLGILLGITFIYSGITNSVTPATALYSGRHVFQTQEDYGAFKTLLTDGNVTVLAFNELSSSFPVLVEYQIKAPLSIDFPYSEPVQTWGKDVGVAKNRMLMGLGVLGIVAGIFLTLKFFHKLG
jgi:hypothetical protein